ncbi:MAG: histidine kinase dimerization/phospho-acceptor domain-containing protein, partial [Planctomycetota bacterium]
MRRPFRTVKSQVIATVLLPAMGLFAALSYYQVSETSRQLEMDFSEQLLRIVTTAALGLDGTAHEKIRSAQDPEFLKARDWLRQVKAANGLHTDLFTYSHGDNRRRYVVMTSANPYVWKPYVAPREIEGLMRTGRACTSPLYENELGTCLSAFAPIRAADGRITGILEADLMADEVIAFERQATLTSIGIGSLVLILTATIAVGFASRLARPVEALIDSARLIASGEFSEEGLPSRTGTEFDELVHSIRTMGAEVTHRQQESHAILRRLKDLDRLKDAFLSSISHELRTPVTSILGCSEILRTMDGLSLEEQREFLGVVHKESERLYFIIEQVLDFSRYQVIPEHLESVELRRIVEDVVESLAHLADEVEVELRIHPEDWPEWELEVHRTRRALSCLIENAIHFSPRPGVVDIHYCVAASEAAPPASILIRDTGTGIPREHWNSIFEPFHQLGGTLTDKPKGIGLGLALARVCMESQGGAVRLLQSDGDGSVFALQLPSDEQSPHVFISRLEDEKLVAVLENIPAPVRGSVSED